jgi:3-isopropylmalate dehydrogenase
MNAKILLLPGDGIGAEVVREGVRVLDAVAGRFGHTFRYDEGLVGGAAIDQAGTPIPDDTLRKLKAADAVFFGAVGGPKWDQAPVRPEAGLLRIRKELGVYANVRPAVLFPALASGSPLREDIVTGTDLLIVRELTGGLYFGKPKERDATMAVDTMLYTAEEVDRIAKFAYEAARKRRKVLHSVDKANILETSRLWREVVTRLASEYPDVAVHHMLVDTASMALVQRPTQFDVIVTENTFGDILSDEAAAVVGSIGLLPSASLGDHPPYFYEPVHGTAPDIAGQGIANPLGCILSAAMMLRYSFGLEREAAAVESAVTRALADGHRTKDLAGPSGISTDRMTNAVLERLPHG